MDELERRRELGRKLRILRERKGLSQDAVARIGRALGENWSRSTVAKWEIGQRAVTLDEFFPSLFGILGIPGGKSLRELVPDAVAPVDASPPGPGEVEEKAARSLGLTLDEVGRLAQRRWNATLTAERERRLTTRLRGKAGITPRTRQAMRGRVTRMLLAELREDLNRKRRRGTR